MSQQKKNLQEILQQDREMSLYFQTLPKSIQETMMQSGMAPANLQELKQCAKNWL